MICYAAQAVVNLGSADRYAGDVVVGECGDGGCEKGKDGMMSEVDDGWGGKW